MQRRYRPSGHPAGGTASNVDVESAIRRGEQKVVRIEVGMIQPGLMESRDQASGSHISGVCGDTPTALGPGVMISTRAGPSPVFSA